MPIGFYTNLYNLKLNFKFSHLLTSPFIEQFINVGTKQSWKKSGEGNSFKIKIANNNYGF